MQFHFHANQSHIHKNGLALRLAFKQRHMGTRKWPIWLWIFLEVYSNLCFANCHVSLRAPWKSKDTELISKFGSVLLFIWRRKWERGSYPWLEYVIRLILNPLHRTVTYTQLFGQRLSHKNVKAYATLRIGIMGSERLALLGWSLRWFSNKDGERMNTRVCVVSFHHAETPWGSLEQPQKPTLPKITFDIVAQTFPRLFLRQPLW